MLNVQHSVASSHHNDMLSNWVHIKHQNTMIIVINPGGVKNGYAVLFFQDFCCFVSILPILSGNW